MQQGRGLALDAAAEQLDQQAKIGQRLAFLEVFRQEKRRLIDDLSCLFDDRGFDHQGTAAAAVQLS